MMRTKLYCNILGENEKENGIIERILSWLDYFLLCIIFLVDGKILFVIFFLLLAKVKDKNKQTTQHYNTCTISSKIILIFHVFVQFFLNQLYILD